MYLPPPSSLPPNSIIDCYVRDSGGSRQEQSTDQQLRAIESYCGQHGLQLRHRFVDEAKSGGSIAGRDEFNRMMALYEIPASRPAGLLLWNHARFARDIDDAQFHKLMIRQWDIVIHSLNDSIPEGDYARVIEFFIDLSNEEKRKQTSADAKRGLRELVQRYRCVPGSAPRGFLREPVRIGEHRDGSPRVAHKWLPDPEVAPRILQAYQMRAAGMSLKKIQDETHLYSSINSYATFWPNKIYIGILEFGDDLVIEDYCEPIVPRDLWEKVQQIQKGYTRWKEQPGTHPRRANSRFLLSGIIFCQLCGSPLYGHSSKQRSGRTLDSYYCTRAWRKRDCIRRRLPRARIEDEVIRLLRDVILKPENFAALHSRLSSGQRTALADQDRRRRDISRRLAKTERQLTNVADAISEQGISPTLSKRLRDLETEKAAILQERVTLEAAALQPVQPISPAALEQTIQTINVVLEKGTHAQKQALLRGLIHSLHIHRADDGIHGTLAYYYPPPESPPSPKALGPVDAVPTPRLPSGPPFYRHSIEISFFIPSKHPRH